MSYHKILKHILIPAGDLLFNTSFSRSLKEVCSLNSKSYQELASIQKNRLKALLDYASAYSAYYQSFNLEKEENPYQWIKKFPVLTKNILRSKTEQLLTTPGKKLKSLSSSGSSGYQSTVYINNKELSLYWANQVNWWGWAGYRVGDSLVQMGVNPKRGLIRRLKDKFFRIVYINSFSLSEEEIVEVLKTAQKKKMKFLCGYSSSLNLFANVSRKYNLSDFYFKGVISLGEKMVDEYRMNIREVFRCPVYETYGSGEGLLIASQNDLESLYINMPHVFLELLDEDGNEVPDGQPGYVVVTSLIHYSMPLIRYKIGDLAVRLPGDEYPKGRAYNMPLLKKVIGRSTDVLKTPSGNYLSVHSFTGLFAKHPQIRQFKVVRRTFDKLEVQYIQDEKFNEDLLSHIKKKIVEEITNEFEIDFKQVEHIAPLESGKPQIIEDLY
jgi:phenylacetate-CoA ligase